MIEGSESIAIAVRTDLIATAEVYLDADGRCAVRDLVFMGDDITADDLRRVSIGEFRRRFQEKMAVALEVSLRRPDGSDPDGFYRTVAAHYRAHVALSGKPAARMAEAAGVPVATVHRWVREARLRGWLPKGRQGRAG